MHHNSKSRSCNLRINYRREELIGRRIETKGKRPKYPIFVIETILIRHSKLRALSPLSTTSAFSLLTVNLLGVLHKILKVNCVIHLLIYCCKMAFRISILFSKFLYLNWTTNLVKGTLRGASEHRVWNSTVFPLPIGTEITMFTYEKKHTYMEALTLQGSEVSAEKPKHYFDH